MASLGPVVPNGVVFHEADNLKCVDPLSGELLWSRSDVPAGCELFGDQELVFAAEVLGQVARVFRMAYGESAGDRKLPEFPWLLTVGRNVAHSGVRGLGNARTMYVRVTDIESQEVLFEADYDEQTRVTTVDPGYVAIYEPTGKFHLVDVREGRLRIDQQLVAVSDSSDLQALVDGENFFLVISSRHAQQHRPIALADYPIINGLVYAFRFESGAPLWPGPALVRNRGIMLGQPTDMPLLLFVDRKSTRDGNTGGGSRVRILCLDKRTGQAIYRNDDLPDTSPTRFRVRGQPGDVPTVSVTMNEAELTLTMSDRPRPPQPPADDDLEAPRSGAARGLWGIAGRMGSALQSAIETPPNEANPNGKDVDEIDAIDPLDDD
jgi:hypothetical protein